MRYNQLIQKRRISVKCADIKSETDQQQDKIQILKQTFQRGRKFMFIPIDQESCRFTSHLIRALSLSLFLPVSSDYHRPYLI